MHEFSIATSLLELVGRYAPAGLKVRKVVIEAGPLQGIDREAMLWAWQSLTREGSCAGAELEIGLQPWQMSCPACGRTWSCAELASRCECGSADAHPVGGRDLILKTLVVDDETTQESGDGSTGDRKCPEAQR